MSKGVAIVLCFFNKLGKVGKIRSVRKTVGLKSNTWGNKVPISKRETEGRLHALKTLCKGQHP